MDELYSADIINNVIYQFQKQSNWIFRTDSISLGFKTILFSLVVVKMGSCLEIVHFCHYITSAFSLVLFRYTEEVEILGYKGF